MMKCRSFFPLLFLFSGLFLFLFGFYAPARAQTEVKKDVGTERNAVPRENESILVDKAENSIPKENQEKPQPKNRSERLELSKKMHMLRPLTPQIKDNINRIVADFPEGSRETARAAMLKSFDFVALQETSVELMADIFTVEELQVMVDYHAHPEARKIAEKMPIFQNMLQPEIVKSLDTAMMALRTGAPADEQEQKENR